MRIPRIKTRRTNCTGFSLVTGRDGNYSYTGATVHAEAVGLSRHMTYFLDMSPTLLPIGRTSSKHGLFWGVVTDYCGRNVQVTTFDIVCLDQELIAFRI